MDFFTAFSLLIAVGFIGSAFFPQRIADPGLSRKALSFFFAALILYYPVSEIFFIGGYLSIVARPVGFVLNLMAFSLLCRALASPRIDGR